MNYGLALGILLVVLFVAVFGLPMILSHGHHNSCPLMGTVEVLCEKTVVDHAAMWQLMLASVVNTLVLIFAAISVLAKIHRESLVRGHVRVRTRLHSPMRPTLLQQLYASGIHNRKEPYACM